MRTPCRHMRAWLPWGYRVLASLPCTCVLITRVRTYATSTLDGATRLSTFSGKWSFFVFLIAEKRLESLSSASPLLETDWLVTPGGRERQLLTAACTSLTKPKRPDSDLNLCPSRLWRPIICRLNIHCACCRGQAVKPTILHYVKDKTCVNNRTIIISGHVLTTGSLPQRFFYHEMSWKDFTCSG